MRKPESQVKRPAVATTYSDRGRHSRTTALDPSTPPSRTHCDNARFKGGGRYPQTQRPNRVAEAFPLENLEDLYHSDRRLYAAQNHPAHRPTLPQRPHLQPGATQSASSAPTLPGGTLRGRPQPSKMARQHVKPSIDTSTEHSTPSKSPSSVLTSFTGTPQSSCASTTSTKATSTCPEPSTPRNVYQGALLSYAQLGFVATTSSNIPNFGRMDVRVGRRRRLECHNFKISDQLYGIISPTTHVICRQGNACFYPRSLNGTCLPHSMSTSR